MLYCWIKIGKWLRCKRMHAPQIWQGVPPLLVVMVDVVDRDELVTAARVYSLATVFLWCGSIMKKKKNIFFCRKTPSLNKSIKKNVRDCKLLLLFVYGDYNWFSVYQVTWYVCVSIYVSIKSAIGSQFKIIVRIEFRKFAENISTASLWNG